MSHGVVAGPAPLASLSLTHVYYDPSDPFAYVSAWLALVPQALCIVYATLVWSTREMEVGLMFAGQLACEAVNFVLKRVIREGRPQHSSYLQHDWLGGRRLGAWAERQTEQLAMQVGEVLGPLLGPLLEPLLVFAADDAAAETSPPPYYTMTTTPQPTVLEHPPCIPDEHPFRLGGYGMPSSHAQFAGYWALTITLFLLVRYRARPTAAAPALSRVERVAASAGAFVLALLIAGSRVYLHYHTPRQVVVGFAAGLAVAAGWFVATAVARSIGLVGWVLRLPPARYLRLRDLACDEDPVQAGWALWTAREAAAAREQTKEKPQQPKPKKNIKQK